MKLDFKSLAFGYNLENGVSTPAWETSLGQGAGYKINDSRTINELIKGMIYKMVAPKAISFKKGRGGTIVRGDADNASLVSAAVFDKIYINDHQIADGKFILLIVKDDSESHRGRLKLKYGLDNAYERSDGTVIKNRDFHNIAADQLGLAENACWFIYDISVEDQDVLRLSAIIVNKDGSETYANSTALHNAWDALIEEDISNKGLANNPIEQTKDIEVVFDASSKNLSVEELVGRLNNMYSSATSGNQSNAIRMFGFKYAESIIASGVAPQKLVDDSDIDSNSYGAEIQKGINMYYSIKNNEYGVAFAEDEAQKTSSILFNTGYTSKFARNRILFGAPGTGKSFTLNGDRKEILYGDHKADETKLDLSKYGEYERVTFHPDYSYANFVGTYKPVPCKDKNGQDGITYEYVPGPFMRTYVKALLNSKTETPKPYLLIIEEINRANVAAVFGDVFQLLDRGEDEVSEYPIQASEDMKKYLSKALGGVPEDYAEIRIPDNMFIWATMNSADQGVFPMDTAFKRRWDFTYLGIDDSEDGVAGKTVVLGTKTGTQDYRRVVEWNELRRAINEELLKYKVNEDKLMGPYFISKKNLPEGNKIDPEEFSRIFKNKVIMYLFDDAAKQKRASLFEGCEEKSRNQYSKICNEFNEKGIFIFGNAISERFMVIPEDDEQ